MVLPAWNYDKQRGAVKLTADAGYIQEVLLKELNERQRQCVTHTYLNNTLCIAGAGSGKTRVIAKRIAFIVTMGHSTDSIIAVTFTNKAAGELKERVASYIGNEADRILMGTFHSICLKLLRQFAPCLGINEDFDIVGPAGCKRILEDILRFRLGYADSGTIEEYRNHISLMKNKLITPDQFDGYAADNLETNYTTHKNSKLLADVYRDYEDSMRQQNAMDYDGLIVNMIRALDVPAIRNYCQDRFKFILVDESQDTNAAQFKLIEGMAGPNNIFLVADIDQTIYEWRGARMENMFDFLDKYPEAETVKLEQNYRSTKTIVKASNAVIKNNRNRFEKTCFTENGTGERINLHTALDSAKETEFVVNEIQKLAGAGYDYKDIAVLFRTNAIGALFEDELISKRIPYLAIKNIDIPQEDYLADDPALSNTDGEKKPENTVKLQTVHSAKGLEYKAVFVVGLEENTFPCYNRDEKDTAAHMEEERRLFYVAITRCQERLYLTRACKRMISGAWRVLKPSPFLGEIPRVLLRFV